MPSFEEESKSFTIPGRTAKEMWFHEVLLSQRRFYDLLKEQDVDHEQFILVTRQHLTLIFNATVRQHLLRELDEKIYAIYHNNPSDTSLIVRQYMVIVQCQQIIGEAMVFCYSTLPTLNQEHAEGVI